MLGEQFEVCALFLLEPVELRFKLAVINFLHNFEAELFSFCSWITKLNQGVVGSAAGLFWFLTLFIRKDFFFTFLPVSY